MCGIVGIAGNINQAEHKAFRDMLLFDVIRGQDSTGVLRVGVIDNSTPDLAKDVGHPINLWDDYSPYKDLFDVRGVMKGSSKVLIGHNRAATIGDITVDNAHPFNFGDLYGVHNGSLWHTYGLEGNFEVDSQAIYNTIHKKGIEHTWENLSGAAALVWWDDGEKRLNFVRNDQRPLFIAFNEKKDTMFWASEPWMITAAMGRNKISFLKDKNNVSIMPTKVEVDKLFTFKVGAISVELEEEKKLKKYIPQASAKNQNGFRGSNGGHKSKKEENKRAKINLGWANNMLKGDKSFRDCLVRLTTCFEMYNAYENKWNYHITGKMVNEDNRIEIVPSTILSFEKWQDIHRKNIGSEVYVKLKARPRYSINNKTGITTFKISSDCIELAKIVHNKKEKAAVVKKEEPQGTQEERKYRGYGQRLCGEKEMLRAIKNARGTCVSCDEVINLDNCEESDWVKEDAILCKTCSEDPYIQNMLRGM